MASVAPISQYNFASVHICPQRCDNYVTALEQSMKDDLRYLHRGLLTITEGEDLWKALMQRYSGTELA